MIPVKKLVARIGVAILGIPILACASAGVKDDVRVAALEHDVRGLQQQIGRVNDRLSRISDRLLILDRRGGVATTAPNNAPDAAGPKQTTSQTTHLERARSVSPESRSHDAPVKFGPSPYLGSRSATPDSGSAEAAFQYALRMYRDGDATHAQTLLEDFIGSFPDHDRQPAALWWLGKIELEAERYDLAIVAYQRLVQYHPSYSRAAEAMFNLGLAYERARAEELARTAFARLCDTYPQSAVAELARRRLSHNLSE